MGLFRKKNRAADVTMDDDQDFDQDDNGSIPKQVTTEGSRRTSSRPSLSKWLGSSVKKLSKKDTKKNSSSNKNGSNMISHSSSTSSSQPEEEREVVSPTASQQNIDTVRTFASSGATQQQKEENDLANSLCSLPPPAALSAFDGPPRFDWIDIEYSAATKIQSFYRRHLVLQSLEEQGLSTSFIRNRKRQRKAARKPLFFHTAKVDEASPDLGFGCCGVGLAFGGGNDFDAADTAAYRNFQRKQYEEKLKAQQDREDVLSMSYLEQKGIKGSVQKLEQCQSREEILTL